MVFVKSLDSPVGVLTLAVEDDSLVALVLEGQKYSEKYIPKNSVSTEHPVFTMTEEWLSAYFDGCRQSPSIIPVTLKGTSFQRLVWNTLREIPYGQTASYGELAHRLGSSARAIGAAVGKNPISILIPCHRVLGSDRSLTGYAGGLEVKCKLLAIEGVFNYR